MNELREKALKMARLDFEINGMFRNAPYRIMHEDELYIVRVRVQRQPHNPDQSESFLSVERPAKNVIHTPM